MQGKQVAMHHVRNSLRLKAQGAGWQSLMHKHKACSWPLRQIGKRRQGGCVKGRRKSCAGAHAATHGQEGLSAPRCTSCL
jgi:hypothetical protein